jgi:hypothetical protein
VHKVVVVVEMVLERPQHLNQSQLHRYTSTSVVKDHPEMALQADSMEAVGLARVTAMRVQAEVLPTSEPVRC